MKVDNLLFINKIGVKKSPRKFVRYRKIQTESPMEYMDIKYVHIHGSKRNALLQIVIDVYSRKNLTHMLEYNITRFTIRNENGSQFIANVVRVYLKEKGVTQEFTHVATPEENSYIEAYHSILQHEVIERFEFEFIYDAKAVFYRYNEWYTQKRKHGSLDNISPEEYLMARAS